MNAGLGDRILFAQAHARLVEILRLMGEFNEIRDTLVTLGYVIDDEHGEPWPLPALELCGNGSTTIRDASEIDEFWARGPVSHRVRPIQRHSMARERGRLGKECGWRCFYCGRSGDEERGPDGRVWHVDHAYPVIRGGDDQPDNHVLACATCNLDKKAATAMEYFARLATVRKSA